MRQENGTTTLNFLYDANGMIGVQYNGANYYYLKNLQGDVIGIYDSNANVVARYTYDVWGNTLSVKDANGANITSSTHIANVNPIRYRGYYYDTESGLYYVNSRYYDPEIGRFINADEPEVLLGLSREHILGINLFAYCFNNPVNYVDHDGRFAISLSILGGAALAKLIIGAVAITAAAIILSDLGFQRAMANAVSALGSGIKSACEAVAKAIDDAFKKAKTRTKNNNYANHHIVAKTAAGAKPARDYLAHKNVWIGLDSSLNLVRIKQNLHYHLHTTAYYTAVNNLLKPANGNYSKTVAALNVIRAALLAMSAKTP